MSTSDPDEIRANIERTRDELSYDVDTLGDRVRPSNVAQRQKDKVRSRVSQVKDRVMGTAHHARESAGGTAHHAADRGREKAASVADSVGSAPRAMREQTQGSPLGVGLVAFGVGLAVASLIPSSRTEQRAATAAQEKAAPLVDDLKSTASEVADDLKQPARESMEAVRDSAKGAAQSVGEHGREAAADVRSRTTGNG